MNLPEDFVKQIESYNCEAMNGLLESLEQTDASVSVRCNVGKGVAVPADVAGVPWWPNGWYLPAREAFTFDPAMHQGLYYVQDASSMILAHIVSRLTAGGSPMRYLDACAAPGGKTTAAIDALPDGSLVVANEYVPTRAAVLRENVIKWGYESAVVSRGDTSRISRLKGFFDIIAADVPCSGEGMFRKEPDAVAQWSRALVDECAERQREIIDNLWPALAPGGYFIYSTCTFNRDEDEDMVQYIIDNYGAESVAVEMLPEWKIANGVNTPHHCYRFMPHLTQGEGLFVAVLRKSADDDASPVKAKKTKSQPQQRDVPSLKEVKTWIADSGSMEFAVEGDRVVAFPKAYAQEYALLSLHLDVIHHGVKVATVKGRDMIPAQSLALSRVLNADVFAACEVDYATAIAYLRREAVALDDAPRGYVLLTYGGRPLGFVKNLGNRANNLYPQEWRILSSHIPETAPKVL